MPLWGDILEIFIGQWKTISGRKAINGWEFGAGCNNNYYTSAIKDIAYDYSVTSSVRADWIQLEFTPEFSFKTQQRIEFRFICISCEFIHALSYLCHSWLFKIYFNLYFNILFLLSFITLYRPYKKS